MHNAVAAQARMWSVLVAPKSNKQKLFAALFWLSVGAGCIVVVVYAFPPLVHDVIEPVVNTIRKKLSPFEVAIVVILALAILPVVFLTHGPFVWIAAMVLGIPWALVVTNIGSTFGMLFPFLLARYILQKPVLHLLEERRSVVTILEVLKRAGTFRVIFLLRIGPPPYSILSYASGIPRHVDITKYMLASILGQLPYNVMDVWFGKNLKGIADLLQGKKMDIGQVLYNVVGLIASILITIGGYWYGRQALRKIREENAAQVEDSAPGADHHVLDHMGHMDDVRHHDDTAVVVSNSGTGIEVAGAPCDGQALFIEANHHAPSSVTGTVTSPSFHSAVSIQAEGERDAALPGACRVQLGAVEEGGDWPREHGTAMPHQVL